MDQLQGKHNGQSEPVELELDMEEELEPDTEEELELEKELDDLRAALEEERALAEEYLSRLQRLQADFDNYRKRMVGERQEWSQRAVGDFVQKLLPVIDNLERALESAHQEIEDSSSGIAEGVDLTLRQLLQVMEQAGVERIDPQDTPFDPNYHEAVMQQETDEFEDRHVMAVFQQGYQLGSRVLRPAMVMVAKNEAGSVKRDSEEPEEPKEE